jgi:eukaryotic-like serine/threonine-protein kinase
MLREALAIRRAALGPDHPYTARVESQLGECLARQRRIEEALPLLRHSAELLHRVLGDEHVETQRASERLHAAESRLAQR